jgi:WD40 repeat protein
VPFSQKFAIEACQKGGDRILGLDYNPNKQCYLMTCHHESLKFWDIRRGSLPVRSYQDHHNLLARARYNPSHDELIACAYDDGTVALLRLHSVCSSPQHDVEDTLVRLYDEHEDSVFKVAWSAFSPWVFASATYNASSLVVNIVPSVEKYRILL